MLITEETPVEHPEALDYIMKSSWGFMKKFPSWWIESYSDDMLSEASIGYVLALKTFKPGKDAAFKSWAWTCMRRKCVDFQRYSLKYHVAVTQRMLYLGDGTSSKNNEEAINNEEVISNKVDAFEPPKESDVLFLNTFQASLDEMPPRDAEMLIAYLLDELELHEVAKIYGVTSGTMGPKIHNMLCKIRSDFKTKTPSSDNWISRAFDQIGKYPSPHEPGRATDSLKYAHLLFALGF